MDWYLLYIDLDILCFCFFEHVLHVILKDILNLYKNWQAVTVQLFLKNSLKR